MDYFVDGINNSSMIDPSLFFGNNIRTKGEANKAFISLFLSQILKNVMDNQSTLYDNSMSAFSGDLYNDILINKISEELSQNRSFGFEKMLGLNSKMTPSIKIGDIK